VKVKLVLGGSKFGYNNNFESSLTSYSLTKEIRENKHKDYNKNYYLFTCPK